MLNKPNPLSRVPQPWRTARVHERKAFGEDLDPCQPALNDADDGSIQTEPKHLGKMQYEKSDGEDGFAGVCELGHDAIEAVASFEDAKHAFDGDACTCIGADWSSERGCCAGIDGRTPEWWSGESNSVIGAPPPIGAGTVDGVGVDGGRIVAG